MSLYSWVVRTQRAPYRWLILAILLGLIHSTSVAGGPWWDDTWKFRVRVTADAAGYARFTKAAETSVNFTQLFTALGTSGTLDENSLRVIETDAAGSILSTSVPFQFDKDPDYNATSKASGTMVILLTGTTGSAATRYYDIYFAKTGGSFSPPSFPQIVGIEENTSDMGQAAYRIDGPGSSMFYQTQAGAFSSWIDANSHDWIEWNFLEGPGGTYRGIPNAIYPESKFHPGALDAVSSVVSKGPLKVTVKTVTGDGKWEARWEFYSRYATMTMVKADHAYWFLYEGIPGGSFDTFTDIVYRADGTRTNLSQPWNADMTGNEWTFFSDVATRRSLFLAHHTDDAHIDSYFNYSDSMTVFGFGRNKDIVEPLMTAVPDRFTLGFVNDTSFTLCRDSINSAAKPLTVTLGTPEEPAPAVPVLVSPANGATGASVPALLRWRTADRATQYHLQVSTSNTFAGGMVVDDSTLTDTTSSVAGLAGKTQYYWRVRSRNAAGGSAYSGTWSFETGLGVPSLLTPSDGATGRQQPVQLTWASVTGAVTYHVQVSTESGFTSGIVVDDATVAGLSRAVSGLAGTTLYYWRVAARDAGGDGPFAAARTFTTSVNSPGLLSPADNAVDQPLSLTLSWSAVSGATYYHLQVSTDPGFGSGMVLDDPSATSTSRVLSGLAQSTRYYWRVSAGDPGGEGAFSSSRSFTTIFPAPVLLTPPNGATGQPLSITFTWNRVAGAVRYHLQLATDTLFTTLIKNDTTITDSVRQVNGLINATWYYWRVKAIAPTTSGPFSPRRSLRTAGILPPAVTLLAPAQSATVPGDSARCSWNGASPATRYWLELGLDSLFTLKLVDSTVTDTSKMVRSLLPNATYWWKVRGGTSDGWGPFSSTRQFTTVVNDVADNDGLLPESYVLEQNYPNPFNPATTIRFALPASGNARLEVFNMLGERVATLLDENRSAGVHAVQFDADGLPSGTYFYRLTANGEVITRRMVLLR